MFAHAHITEADKRLSSSRKIETHLGRWFFGGRWGYLGNCAGEGHRGETFLSVDFTFIVHTLAVSLLPERSDCD